MKKQLGNQAVGAWRLSCGGTWRLSCVAAWRSSERDTYFVVAGGGGDGDVGDVEHLDTVLVAIGGVGDVALGSGEGDAVAGCGAVEEGEVAGGFGLGEVEVVLGGQGGGLDHHRAAGLAVGDEDLLGAADQLAVDSAVGNVEADGLEAAGVSEELEGGGVALLEDQGAGLSAVGDSWGGGVSRGVVDADHREVEGGDLAHSGVHGEGAPAAGGLVQDAVVVEVDGGGAEGGADGGVGDGGGGHDRLAHAARLQDAAKARGGASSAGTSKLHLERDAYAAVGQQLRAVAEVGADQVAADQIGLDRRDVEVAHQQGVGACRAAVGAVGRLLLDEDQPLASKCHGPVPGWMGLCKGWLIPRSAAPTPTRWDRGCRSRRHRDSGAEGVEQGRRG